MSVLLYYCILQEESYFGIFIYYISVKFQIFYYLDSNYMLICVWEKTRICLYLYMYLKNFYSNLRCIPLWMFIFLQEFVYMFVCVCLCAGSPWHIKVTDPRKVKVVKSRMNGYVPVTGAYRMVLNEIYTVVFDTSDAGPGKDDFFENLNTVNSA